MPGTFKDGKDEGALRTIGEVSSALGIKPHVLRYWEQQFPMLSPLKRSGGRRYYRPEDIQLIESIDRLVNREGFTLKGARAALSNKGASEAKRPVGMSDAAKTPDPAAVPSEIIKRLEGLRNRLEKALEA